MRYFLIDTATPISSKLFASYMDLDILIESTVFIITTDDGVGSGISLKWYKIDDSVWLDYLGPFDLSAYRNGEYIITCQAIDVAGNIEIEHGITVTLISKPSSEPSIPGYHLFVIICIICTVSAIFIKKGLKFKF